MASRTPSTASSLHAMDSCDDENNIATPPHEETYGLKSPGELELELELHSQADVERAGLLPQDELAAEHEKKAEPTPDHGMRAAVIWMVVNTLATIGIVSFGFSVLDCAQRLIGFRNRFSPTRPSSPILR
jgi:hypothetical protein